jgi:hypothetical protein
MISGLATTGRPPRGRGQALAGPGDDELADELRQRDDAPETRARRLSPYGPAAWKAPMMMAAASAGALAMGWAPCHQ